MAIDLASVLRLYPDHTSSNIRVPDWLRDTPPAMIAKP